MLRTGRPTSFRAAGAAPQPRPHCREHPVEVVGHHKIWSVLVIDAGEPRNTPAAGVHGFLTRDGMVSTLSRLESGQRRPNLELLLPLAQPTASRSMS